MRKLLNRRVLLIVALMASISAGAISASQQPNVPARHVSVHQTHVYKPKPAPVPAAQPTNTSDTGLKVPTTPKPLPSTPLPPRVAATSCLSPTAFEAGVNSVRAQHGLPPLCSKSGLRQAALYRANYMCQTNTFSHAGFYAGQLNAFYTAPHGLTGENISAGLYPGGDGQVVQEFVDSPEHYANMIRGDYLEQGAASIVCNPPYCTAIGICNTPVPVQINVNDFGG